MSAPAHERSAAAKLRSEIYRGAGIEPTRILRASNIPQYEERAKLAGVLHRNAHYEAARSLTFPAQLRATKAKGKDDEDLYDFEGIASATDTPYEMYDSSGPYDEIIEAGAFTETLAANPDVAFLMNHTGITMARTTNGSLELDMLDGEGLRARAKLNPKRNDISDMLTGIEDGVLTEMSFAFMLDEGWWNDDFTTFKITKLNLNRGDVSVVNYGANPYTSIGARASEVLRDLRHLPTGAARAAISILSGRADVAKLEARLQAAETVFETDVDRRMDKLGMTEPAKKPSGRSVAYHEAVMLGKDG
jgi:HK97 family phage prohead protease